MGDDALMFLEVCRRGSFSAAGDVLGVADSTVARRLGQLEERLGARLVERSTRGLTLTEAGEVYREQVERAELALRDGEEAVRRWRDNPAGRLRVAAPMSLLRFGLGPVVRDYLARYPDVCLEVVGGDDDPVPDGRELHLAVRVSTGGPPPHLKQRLLAQVRMELVASPEWVAKHGTISSPDELARHRCVVLGSAPSAAHVRLHGPTGERRLTVPMALFTTSLSVARQAALDGVGPTGLPLDTCQGPLDRGELVSLVPDWELARVPVVALYAGDRAMPLRMRAFLDLLVQAYSSPAHQRESADSSR